MGYMHIKNLYRDQEVLLFKQVYALEKIHGSSSHITWKDGKVNFSAGGVDHASFMALFNVDNLTDSFTQLGYPSVVVYGEAYGGKCHKMSDTYGPNLKFVAFEVKIDDTWLNVPNAYDVCRKLNLDFVGYDLINSTMEEIDAMRDAPSVQAAKNGIGIDKMREGIVIRPPIEVTKSNGERIIAKHKRDEFRETKTPRVLTEKSQVIADAELAVLEWVTPMRLEHILQKYNNPSIENTRDVINSMIEDVLREGKDEVMETRELKTLIGKQTAKMFKEHLRGKLNGLV
jgi:hypothetical protein